MSKSTRTYLSLNHLTVQTPLKYLFQHFTAVFSCIAALFILCACSSDTRLFSVGGNQLPRETVYIHEVKYDGENLNMLAAWYFQDETQWPVIAKYNGSDSEQNIHIGQSIILPEKGLQKNEQLPHAFALAFLQKVKNKPLPQNVQHEKELPEADKEELVDEFMKKALDESSR